MEIAISRSAPRPYRMDRLPPFECGDVLRTVLRFVPAELREDAVQVAWIAFLDGGAKVDDEAERDVSRAVDTWRRGEVRHCAREIAFDPHAHERHPDEHAGKDRRGHRRRRR